MAENKKKKQSVRSCDVLIIGSGSAGLRAAIEAHDAGAHVLIISKSMKGEIPRAPNSFPTDALRSGSKSVGLLIEWG